MAPKKKFSREQIIEAAFDIARKEGMDRITIRKVADHLESSIAPIYVNFRDVEELKKEVIKKIAHLSRQLLNEHDSGRPFYDIGAASLKFASEYSVLFRDFVMKQNHYLQDYDREMGTRLVEHMKKDDELKGFTDEELSMILFKMRVFTTGLSVMVANGLLPKEYGGDKNRELLEQVGTDLIEAARLRKKKERLNGQ